jgi:hypothetical protein
MSSGIKRLIIAIAVLGGLVLAVFALVPSFVPTEQAQQQLKSGLEQAGFALESNASPSVSFTSGVRLSFADVKVRGTSDAVKAIAMNAGELVVNLPLSALWGEFSIDDVTLNKAAITYTRANDEAEVADEAKDPVLVQGLLLLSSIESPAYNLHLTDSSLRVSNAGDAPGGTPQATGLKLDLLQQSGGWVLSGAGSLRGQETQLEMQSLPGEAGAQHVKFALKNNVTTLSYEGSRNAATPPLVQGKLLFEAADTEAFYSLLMGEAVATEEAPAAEKAPDALPVAVPEVSGSAAPAAPTAEDVAALVPKAGGKARVAADLFYQQRRMVLKNIELDVPGVKLTGEAGGALDAPYNIQASLQFETLDSNAFTTLGGMARGNWLPVVIQEGLDAKANARVRVTAANVRGLLTGEQLAGLLVLEDGGAQISNFSVKGPGGALIGFTGNFAITPQGPTLMGKVSGQGEEFNTFLPAITNMPLTLPKEGFGSFAFSGDFRLSPEDIRLSDMRAKIGAMVVNMAYVHQSATKDTGIRLAVSGLNADALLDSTATDDLKFFTHKTEDLVQAHVLPPYVQDVLLKLRANYNIYLYAENYIYDSRPGEPLEVRLQVGRGKINLEQFATRLSGADIGISGFVDINSSVPRMQLDMKLGDLDVGRMQAWLNDDASKEDAADSKTASAASIRGNEEGEVWSNKPLNWNFIPLAEGTITLQAARILHPAATLTNANIKMSLSNERLTLEQSSASLYNADLTLKGEMTGGALPTWKTAFSISNLEIAEMQRMLPWLSSVQGRVSLSGVAVSSGASLLAQMRNMKANAALTGRAVQINEFDLGSAVDAMRQLTNVDDLKQTLDRNLPKSNTRFDTLEGLFDVADGKLNITRLWLRGGRFAGEVAGSANLLTWKAETRTRFPLSVLVQKNPPEVVLVATGAPDALKITREDRSLEQFVVQKTANELIQGRQ